MIKIDIKDLKDGDILLYSRDSLISNLIKFFDKSPYSHSGIFVNGYILEAVSKGVIKSLVSESILDVDFIDVYKFKAPDGETLGDINYPFEPIKNVVNKYELRHDRYAYETILLLAILTTTRRIRIQVFSWLIKNILEHALDILNRIIADGKEPMICSELVYRCFDEADLNGKYSLFIKGIEQKINLEEIQKIDYIDNIIREKREVQELREKFLNKYIKRKTKNSNYEASVEAILSTIADFVTPHDLIDSPNLKLVGRLNI
ncbi:hypothetical protein BH10BAC5_BH10BAC5_20060 [soil metagenome]